MKRILIGVGLLAASGIAASVVATSPGGAAPSSSQLLFVNYTARSDCAVLPNYPKAGVVGNAAFDTIRAGQVLVWRYNAHPTWSVARRHSARSSPSRDRQRSAHLARRRHRPYAAAGLDRGLRAERAALGLHPDPRPTMSA